MVSMIGDAFAFSLRTVEEILIRDPGGNNAIVFALVMPLTDVWVDGGLVGRVE